MCRFPWPARSGLQLPLVRRIFWLRPFGIVGSVACRWIITDDLYLLLQVLAPRRSHLLAAVECMIPAVGPSVVLCRLERTPPRL